MRDDSYKLKKLEVATGSDQRSRMPRLVGLGLDGQLKKWATS